MVKIGSSLLTDFGQGLAVDLVNNWVDDLVKVSNSGVNIVIVSSGAVAALSGRGDRPTCAQVC